MTDAQGHEEPRCAPPFKGAHHTAVSISLAEEGPEKVGMSKVIRSGVLPRLRERATPRPRVSPVKEHLKDSEGPDALTYWPDFLVIKSMIWFTYGLEGSLRLYVRLGCSGCRSKVVASIGGCSAC